MVNRKARVLLEACIDNGTAADWDDFIGRFEKELVAGVARGFRRFGRYARPEQLEDLVQESYCKLLADECRVLRRCKSESEVAIGVYLGRVAERVAFDSLRRGCAERRGGGRLESLENRAERGGESEWPMTPATAEDRLISRERIERFFACCRKIGGRRKERDVRIVRMALVDGLTSSEISESLGRLISPTGIDTVLHRIRRRLVAEGIVLPKRRPVGAT